MKRIFILFFSFALIAFPVYALGDETALPPTETENSNPPAVVEVTDENQNQNNLVEEEVVEEMVEEEVIQEETPETISSEVSNENVESDTETSEETSTENPDEETPIDLVQGFSLALAVVERLASHCGDINQDLVVDLTDLELAQDYIFEGGVALSGANYDLNNDGFPDILDIVTLVNYTHRHMLPVDCVLDTSNENENPSFVNFNPPTSTFVGDIFSYDIEATDPEDNPLSFSLLTGPDGMVISSSTGEITWTPDVDDATRTPYLVTVQVSDGVSDLSASFNLLVSLKSNAFMCGDLNGDGLINQLDLDMIVSIAFDGGTAHPQAHPDLNGDGVVDVIDVVLMVNHVNRGAPAPTCGDNVAPSFTNFNPATTTIATEVYSYDAEASDPNGDPFVFSLVSGPTGMTMNTSSGLISWTPTEAQATSTPYEVTVKVSDGSASSTQTYSITVSPKPIIPPVDNGGGGGSVNVPAGPSGGGGLIGGGTSQNLPPYFVNFNPPSVVTALQAYIYDADAVDPEGQTLSFKLLAGPVGMSVINFNGLILWVPSTSQVSGTAYQAAIEISDGVSVTSTNFQVIVNAPAEVVIAAPVQDFGEGVEEILPPAEIEPEAEPSEIPPPVANKGEEEKGFANALFAGILDFFGSLGDWILSHPFWSLLILALLFIFWFTIFKRRKGDEEEKKDAPLETGAVFQSSSEATPTIITMPTPPSESNESHYS